MPSWNEYKAGAKERGALALELFVVHTTPVGDPAAVKAALADHLAYQLKLEAEGHLVMAGPMSDETGEEMQGVGMIVYRAPSMVAARALAEADPMHATGARSFTLRKWLVNEGGLTLTVRLAAQSASLT